VKEKRGLELFLTGCANAEKRHERTEHLARNRGGRRKGRMKLARDKLPAKKGDDEKHYILVIPYLPPPELSPNARVFWVKKYQAAKQLKEDTYYLAKQAAIPRFTTATLQFTFVVPDSRRRDPDNYLAMMKPVIDGLVLAGVLPDDSFSVVSYAPVLLRIEGKGNSRTIVEIWGEMEFSKTRRLQL